MPASVAFSASRQAGSLASSLLCIVMQSSLRKVIPCAGAKGGPLLHKRPARRQGQEQQPATGKQALELLPGTDVICLPAQLNP